MADEQRKLVALGRDPIAERIAERNAAKVEQRRQAASELTFGQCADKLFADLSVDLASPEAQAAVDQQPAQPCRDAA